MILKILMLVSLFSFAARADSAANLSCTISGGPQNSTCTLPNLVLPNATVVTLDLSGAGCPSEPILKTTMDYNQFDSTITLALQNQVTSQIASKTWYGVSGLLIPIFYAVTDSNLVVIEINCSIESVTN